MYEFICSELNEYTSKFFFTIFRKQKKIVLFCENGEKTWRCIHVGILIHISGAKNCI